MTEPMDLVVNDAGVRTKTENVRRRSHAKVPKVLGSTFVTTTWPLRDLTFTARRGEVLAVFDAVAHRESLLLRLLAGLVVADEGSVTPLPRPVLITVPRGRMVRGLSVGQAIRMIAGMMGMTDAEVDDRFGRIARIAGAKDMLTRDAQEAEPILFKQIAFAAGTSLPTALVLFDRTAVVGDQEFREFCRTRIGQLRDAGAVVVMRSPRIPHVRSVADRGLFLDDDGARVLGKRAFVREIREVRRKWGKRGRGRGRR